MNHALSILIVNMADAESKKLDLIRGHIFQSITSSTYDLLFSEIDELKKIVEETKFMIDIEFHIPFKERNYPFIIKPEIL